MSVKERVVCFESIEGAGIRFIRQYDDLPRNLRNRIQNSLINIYVICLLYRLELNHAIEYDWDEYRYYIKNDFRCEEVISSMEKTVLEGENQ